MTTDKSQQADSGELILESGIVSYASADLGSWSLPISSIKVVGEYTNDHGPHLDDYFLVFVTDTTGEWSQASFYAKGRDKLWHELELMLPGLANLGLNNSTDWESRVLWPQEMQGNSLFDFVRPRRSDGFIGRIISALDSKIEIKITETVLRSIRANP